MNSGNVARQRRLHAPPLGARDQKILRHVCRFGLTTAPVLHRLFFAERTAKAVERVVTRLLKTGWLVSYPLYHPCRYYRLAPGVPGRFRLDPEMSEPYGTQAVIRAYGTLAFCCLASERRAKLTSGEFGQKFPQLHHRELPAYGYYLDEDGKNGWRLGWILIDHGSHYRRLIHKSQRIIAQRMTLAAFRQLIQRRRFVLTFVIADSEKRDRLAADLREKSSDVLYRVEVVPELRHLIGGAHAS